MPVWGSPCEAWTAHENRPPALTPAVAVCGCPYLVAVFPREELQRERPLLRAIQFPAVEKGTLALLYKGRFPLLQRTGRCSRCGVSLYLQIGVLGLNASFWRLLECGLRLGVASDCTLRLERISRFPPMKTVPWRQNTVISWLCRSLRIMTARMPVWTCIWVVCRTFLSLPKGKQEVGAVLIPNHGRKLLPRPPRNQGQSKQYHQLKQPRNTKREAPLGRSI